MVRNGPASQVDETIARYGVFIELVSRRGPIKPIALWRELSPTRPELTKEAVAGMIRHWARNGAAISMTYGTYKPLLAIEQFETAWRERSSSRIEAALEAVKPVHARMAADAAARREAKREAALLEKATKPARAELIPPKPRIDLTCPAWLRGLV